MLLQCHLIIVLVVLAAHGWIDDTSFLTDLNLCFGDHFPIPHGIYSRILSWTWSIGVTMATSVPPPPKP